MKPWYTSKTLWVNGLALVIAIVQALQGQTWFPADTQATVLAIANVGLRFLTTDALSAGEGKALRIGGGR